MSKKYILEITTAIQDQEAELEVLREKLDAYESNHPSQRLEVSQKITLAVNAIEKLKVLKNQYEKKNEAI